MPPETHSFLLCKARTCDCPRQATACRRRALFWIAVLLPSAESFLFAAGRAWGIVVHCRVTLRGPVLEAVCLLH